MPPMPAFDLNWIGIVLAALSAFALGGLWYGPLFKKTWCREAGVDPDSAPRHPVHTFGAAFFCALLAAVMFDVFLPAGTRPDQGFAVGFVVGLFFVSMSLGINYAFARRSLVLWMIDSGYHVLQFALYGMILGAWR
ncbi:MAG: DUF1761 domain-containing protein [Pseudomonadota bacterium]|nr:DUF1761 domain-containing protein [Pseudomonadota bacterium]